MDGVGVWHWSPVAAVRVPILSGISWRVDSGQCWVVLGANGAGKSTLLRIAGANAFPSTGSVSILGRRLGETETAALRGEIGHVDLLDARRFAPRLTVEEIVQTGATRTIGLFPDCLSRNDFDRAAELVAAFGLARVAKRTLDTCSQGERARTLVARALFGRPRLLLLDEPAAGIDLPGREDLLRALDRLRADTPSLAIVLTTHHLEEIPRCATHALLLRGGLPLAAGPIGDVLTDALLSECFSVPLTVTHAGGRWAARARG